MSEDGAGTLIVDDSGDLRSSLESALGHLGLGEVLFAATVPEAELILESHSVTRIVCDWKMPAASGLEFLELIRTERPEVECILMTGFGEELLADDAALPQGVRLVEKRDLGLGDLATLLGASLPAVPVEILPDSAGRKSVFSETSGPEDLIASQRIELERLKSQQAVRDHAVKEIARDLVEDLHNIPGLEKKTILGAGGRDLSVSELIGEIERLTPEGRRLIKLDRAVRRRLLTLRSRDL